MLLFDYSLRFVFSLVFNFEFEICNANERSGGKHVVIESERLIRAPTHTPIGEKVLVCATVCTHETVSQWGKHGLKRRGGVAGLHRIHLILLKAHYVGFS